MKNLVSDTGVLNGPRKQFSASRPETTKPLFYCLQWSVWGKGKDITSYVFGGKYNWLQLSQSSTFLPYVLMLILDSEVKTSLQRKARLQKY